MSDQPLFDLAEALLQKRIADDICHATRFEEYHSQNPHVYEAFKRFTLQLIATGRTRIGARMIVERLRWESMVRASGEYKLNDHFTPFFVRLFVKEFPEHKDLFATRKANADTELAI